MPSIEHPIPQDPIIMKEYYPVGYYTTQEKFQEDYVYKPKN